MKNLFVAAFVLGLAFSSNAQKEEKVRELGLSFSNLDDFNMVYRFGNQEALWRLSLINARINYQPVNNSRESLNAGLGLRFGREWRKPMSPKFKLRYGADFSAALNYTKSNFGEDLYTQSIGYRTGAVGVFGFNFEMGRGLIFGAELLPSLNYTRSQNKRKVESTNGEEISSNSQVGFNLNNSLELSLVYQF